MPVKLSFSPMKFRNGFCARLPDQYAVGTIEILPGDTDWTIMVGFGKVVATGIQTQAEAQNKLAEILETQNPWPNCPIVNNRLTGPGIIPR